MTGHRKFGKRRQQLGTSLEYRELERRRRAVQALTAVREARGVTQVEVARTWGTTQSNVSRFEHAQDTYVSTLMRYAAALGGRLELRVVFPDQAVDLTLCAWREVTTAMLRAVPVNEYFARCPELVLGRPTLRFGRYGPQWGVEPTGNLAAALVRATRSLVASTGVASLRRAQVCGRVSRRVVHARTSSPAASARLSCARRGAGRRNSTFASPVRLSRPLRLVAPTTVILPAWWIPLAWTVAARAGFRRQGSLRAHECSLVPADRPLTPSRPAAAPAKRSTTSGLSSFRSTEARSILAWLPATPRLPSVNDFPDNVGYRLL